MPSALTIVSDCRIFLIVLRVMIGWIKYLWGCDLSKENDIFYSCQVPTQHKSEILNDLDQRLSSFLAWRFNQSFASQINYFQIKKDNIKRKPLGTGYLWVICWCYPSNQITWNDVLFSEVKRSPLLWWHSPLKVLRHVPIFSKHHWFFLRNLPLSLAIIGNFWKRFRNDCLVFGQLLQNL